MVKVGITDAIKLAKLARTAHNHLDIIREHARTHQQRGGIVADNHAPVPHHRLKGHMDKLVAKMGRGGDERQRVPNNVSVARRMRDNDTIIVDRPLG